MEYPSTYKLLYTNPKNPTLGLNAGGDANVLNRNGKQAKTVYLGFFCLFVLYLIDIFILIVSAIIYPPTNSYLKGYWGK